jgi:hypothetical protein
VHLNSGFAARAEPSPFEAAAYAKVTRRLIPFLFSCYVVAYLDRVNLGFAKLQMARALRFSETVYGAGAGIFFIGYFLFGVPSNLILHRVGARRWIGRIMITWGLASAAMVVVSTPATFYLVRFILGLAEAGFYPGIILYLTTWYPAHQRGRIVALFMTAVPIASVLRACWERRFRDEFCVPAVETGARKDGHGFFLSRRFPPSSWGWPRFSSSRMGLTRPVGSIRRKRRSCENNSRRRVAAWKHAPPGRPFSIPRPGSPSWSTSAFASDCTA